MPTSKATSSKARPQSRDEAHLLREIIRTHQVLMAEFLRTIGMPLSRVVLMRLLAKSKGSVGVSELARELGASASATARQISEMESDGLVRRSQDPEDRRRSCVRLSPRGQKAFRGIHDRSRQLEHALASRLGARESAVAVGVLTKLRALVTRPAREAKHSSRTGQH